MNDVIKLGIIGCGNMGSNHIRVLSTLKGVKIDFIYDSNLELMQKFSKTYQISECRNLDLSLRNVDAIIIASPTSTHFEYIKKASEYIKNIFVEKPLCKTTEEAELISTLALEKKLFIQIGFIERFNPAITILKNILNINEEVINIDFSRTNKVSSRITDVDVILDLMIHDIDLSMFLNGAIIDIRATGYIENQRIVFALAHLRHENGCTSRLQASSITQKKMRLIQATSKDSFIQCDLLRKEVVISRESELKKNELNSYTISANEEHIQVPQMEALQMELIDFIDNVALKRLNEGLTPTLKSGVDTIQVAKKISNLIKEN